eukprot:1191051-Prorocentrum_minimum.AAC.4
MVGWPRSIVSRTANACGKIGPQALLGSWSESAFGSMDSLMSLRTLAAARTPFLKLSKALINLARILYRGDQRPWRAAKEGNPANPAPLVAFGQRHARRAREFGWKTCLWLPPCFEHGARHPSAGGAPGGKRMHSTCRYYRVRQVEGPGRSQKVLHGHEESGTIPSSLATGRTDWGDSHPMPTIGAVSKSRCVRVVILW